MVYTKHMLIAVFVTLFTLEGSIDGWQTTTDKIAMTTVVQRKFCFLLKGLLRELLGLVLFQCNNLVGEKQGEM